MLLEQDTPEPVVTGLSVRPWSMLGGGEQAMVAALAKAARNRQAIRIYYHPKIQCLGDNTSISLVDGTEVPIADLVGRDPFWVYSYDHETGKIVPGKATAHKTRKNAELVEVTLDNGEKVRCTPDHPWMLRDGTYREAEDLKPNDSLMPLYRKLDEWGYEQFKSLSTNRWRYTHRYFVEGEPSDLVHHESFDKRNNCPGNLQWITQLDHLQLHHMSSKTRKKISEANKGQVVSFETRKKKSEAAKKHYADHPETGEKISCSLEGHTVSMKTREKVRQTHLKRYCNHKVISVQKLDRREDTYDLSVEKYHNFALTSGVFVHNCQPGGPQAGQRSFVYRTVFPYSLRIRNIHVNGYSNPPQPVVVFFGYDPYARTIKMFVMDRIATIEFKGRKYVPEWPVELESIRSEIDRLLREITTTGCVAGYDVPLGAIPQGRRKKKKRKKKKLTKVSERIFNPPQEWIDEITDWIFSFSDSEGTFSKAFTFDYQGKSLTVPVFVELIGGTSFNCLGKQTLDGIKIHLVGLFPVHLSHEGVRKDISHTVWHELVHHLHVRELPDVKARIATATKGRQERPRGRSGYWSNPAEREVLISEILQSIEGWSSPVKSVYDLEFRLPDILMYRLLEPDQKRYVLKRFIRHFGFTER